MQSAGKRALAGRMPEMAALSRVGVTTVEAVTLYFRPRNASVSARAFTSHAIDLKTGRGFGKTVDSIILRLLVCTRNLFQNTFLQSFFFHVLLHCQALEVLNVRLADPQFSENAPDRCQKIGHIFARVGQGQAELVPHNCLLHSARFATLVQTSMPMPNTEFHLNTSTLIK